MWGVKRVCGGGDAGGVGKEAWVCVGVCGWW